MDLSIDFGSYGMLFIYQWLMVVGFMYLIYTLDQIANKKDKKDQDPKSNKKPEKDAGPKPKKPNFLGYFWQNLQFFYKIIWRDSSESQSSTKDIYDLSKLVDEFGQPVHLNELLLVIHIRATTRYISLKSYKKTAMIASLKKYETLSQLSALFIEENKHLVQGKYEYQSNQNFFFKKGNLLTLWFGAKKEQIEPIELLQYGNTCIIKNIEDFCFIREKIKIAIEELDCFVRDHLMYDNFAIGKILLLIFSLENKEDCVKKRVGDSSCEEYQLNMFGERDEEGVDRNNNESLDSLKLGNEEVDNGENYEEEQEVDSDLEFCVNDDESTINVRCLTHSEESVIEAFAWKIDDCDKKTLVGCKENIVDQNQEQSSNDNKGNSIHKDSNDQNAIEIVTNQNQNTLDGIVPNILDQQNSQSNADITGNDNTNNKEDSMIITENKQEPTENSATSEEEKCQSFSESTNYDIKSLNDDSSISNLFFETNHEYHCQNNNGCNHWYWVIIKCIFLYFWINEIVLTSYSIDEPRDYYYEYKLNYIGNREIKFNSGNLYTGHTYKNQLDGWGIKTFVNGDKYSGYFKNDLSNGYGIYEKYDKTEVHSCNWVDGRQSGFCVIEIVQPNKHKIIKTGNFYGTPSRMQGFGNIAYVYPNDDIYRTTGWFKNGKRHGFILKEEEKHKSYIKATGYFKNDRMHGQVKVVKVNKANLKIDNLGLQNNEWLSIPKCLSPKMIYKIYLGYTYNGLENGWGVEIKGKGEIYYGMWRNGHRHGWGRNVRSRSYYQIGNFVNGITRGYLQHFEKNGSMFAGYLGDDYQFQGINYIIEKDGSFFFGNYKNGMKEGTGVNILKNGDLYFGGFAAQKNLGYGSYYQTNGNVVQGNWVNNEAVTPAMKNR